jgi:hypothetical protein
LMFPAEVTIARDGNFRTRPRRSGWPPYLPERWAHCYWGITVLTGGSSTPAGSAQECGQTNSGISGSCFSRCRRAKCRSTSRRRAVPDSGRLWSRRGFIGFGQELAAIETVAAGRKFRPLGQTKVAAESESGRLNPQARFARRPRENPPVLPPGEGARRVFPDRAIAILDPNAIYARGKWLFS